MASSSHLGNANPFAPIVPTQENFKGGDPSKLFISDLLPEERQLLQDSFLEARPRTYLEIGVGWAGSFSLLLSCRDQSGLKTRFYGLDCFDRILDVEPNTHISGWPSYDLVAQALSHRFGNYQLIVGLAKDSGRLVPKPIDMAFHDANHTYAALNRDLFILYGLLSEKGIVAVHSTSLGRDPDRYYVARDGGPRRAVDEQICQGKYVRRQEADRLTILEKR